MAVMDCGGKRSATPLLVAYNVSLKRSWLTVPKRCRRCALPPQSKTDCYGLAGFGPAKKFTTHATDSVSNVPINVNHGQNILCVG